MSEDDVFFSLCDGYEGVYPYMTANYKRRSHCVAAGETL